MLRRLSFALVPVLAASVAAQAPSTALDPFQTIADKAVMATLERAPSPHSSSSRTKGLLKARPSDPQERHLANVRQLTFGGENAEAYWSPDGQWISLQSTRDGHGCDRIFRMRPDGTGLKQLSSGAGVTTCAHYLGEDKIVYASTFLKMKECPPRPDHSHGYVWVLHPEYDIFVRRSNGLGLTRLTNEPGYDAEATVSPDGETILFTSLRTGDPEMFLMDADGTNVRQITDGPGYDGGGFYSPDGSKIIWRRTATMDAKQLAEYQRLLSNNMVRPGKMDLWVMDADGSNHREVLANGAANFAPYGLPDGSGILFASNMGDPKGRNFDLYVIGYDGSGLERVTFYDGFDAFPHFSPDGKQLLFSSNRFGSKRGETNVFLADWVR